MSRVRIAELFFAEDGLTYHGRDPFTGVGADGELRETYRLHEDSPDFAALRGLREVYGQGKGGAQG